MKITMYELLGMVKDDKAPKKIKYKNKIYYYHKGYDFKYLYNSSGGSPLDKEKSLFTFNSYKLKDGKECWDDNSTIDFLNSKVEILEEKKKIPEKLGVIYYAEDPATIIIHHKVDEIIDYLKSKGE